MAFRSRLPALLTVVLCRPFFRGLPPRGGQRWAGWGNANWRSF